MYRREFPVPTPWIYIGAELVGNDWVWETSARITHPIAWLPGEPNSGGQEMCMSIGQREGSGLGFNDADCTHSFSYFCQKIGN